MVCIVVPEGLSDPNFHKYPEMILTDHFEALINKVARQVHEGEEVIIAPGNAFGHVKNEEEYAAEYLEKKRSDLFVHVVPNLEDGRYLDTFDNARILRKWIKINKRWPLDNIQLYCNWLHVGRSMLLFKLLGFRIDKVVSARPNTLQRKVAPSLWYYHYPVIHFLYEFLAVFHGLWRYLIYLLSCTNTTRIII